MRKFLAILLLLTAAPFVRAAAVLPLTFYPIQTNDFIRSFPGASWGSTNAVLFTDKVVFMDGTNTLTEKWYDSSTIAQAESIALANSTVWLLGRELTKQTNMLLRTYTIGATSLVQTAEIQLGDYTREWLPSEMVYTPNGLCVFSYHNTPTANGSLWVKCWYRAHGSGLWSTNEAIFPMQSAGSTNSITRCNSCAEIHPADGSVWCFWGRDSLAHFDALQVHTTIGGITSIPRPQIIDQRKYGEFGREGEHPWMRLQADRVHNSLRLAYQRNNFIIWQTAPFWKAAKMAIANISQNATPPISFVGFDTWVERISSFGFAVVDGNPVLIYREQKPTYPQYYPTSVAAWSNGTWNTQTLLQGTTYHGDDIANAALFYQATNQVSYLAPLVQSSPIPPPAQTYYSFTMSLVAMTNNKPWFTTNLVIEPTP